MLHGMVLRQVYTCDNPAFFGKFALILLPNSNSYQTLLVIFLRFDYTTSEEIVCGQFYAKRIVIQRLNWEILVMVFGTFQNLVVLI